MSALILTLVLGAAIPTVGPNGSVGYPCRLPSVVTVPRGCSREGSVVKPPGRDGRR